MTNHPLVKRARRIKLEHKIMFLSVAAGIFVWVVYSFVDGWFFFGGSFVDGLIRPGSMRELQKRLFTTASFAAFGVLVSRLLAMRRKAMEATKRAAEALQKSQMRYRLLAENISDVIWVFDIKTKQATYVSPSVTQLLGYSVDEARSLRKRDLFAPASLPGVLEMSSEKIAEQMAKSESSLTFEQEMRRKDRTPVWTETSPSVLNDDSGEPKELIFVMRDISERKQTEERLLQSQKMEAIGRLAGGVAHDFNNILTTIVGNLDIIGSDSSLAGKSRVLVGEVLTAANRASKLTRQLLSFSRQRVTVAEVLNLNDVLRQMNSMLKRLIREDIKIEFDLEKNLASIRADSVQMEQVIMNLAVNARDAMPHGGTLSMRTHSLLFRLRRRTSHGYVDPGAYVVLSVSDTGEGISPASVSHIFEPFYTTKQMGRGTGLGLSTVYHIVEQSSGRLDVMSELGKGTCFKIYLPAVGEDAMRVENVVEVSEPQPVVQGRGETILVVEDELAVMDLIERVLTMAGYDARTAASGGEAMAMAQELGDGVALLLTDVIMPEIQGEELAKIITSRCPSTKVLFMSGYTDDAIEHVSGPAKKKWFISKPFTPDDLLRHVRRVLDG